MFPSQFCCRKEEAAKLLFMYKEEIFLFHLWIINKSTEIHLLILKCFHFQFKILQLTVCTLERELLWLVKNSLFMSVQNDITCDNILLCQQAKYLLLISVLRPQEEVHGLAVFMYPLSCYAFPSSDLSYISLQLSSHSIHMDVGVDNHIIIFTNDKCFGLTGAWWRGWNRIQLQAEM